MKRLNLNFILIAFVFTVSSCATVLNSRTKRIDITTTSPAKIIFNNDMLATVDNQTTIQVERQKQPLKIEVFNNDFSKTIKINSKNSFAYWLNAYPSILGAGFLIDKKSVVYHPTIFRISPQPQFTYEHLISIDFGYKIRLKK